MSTSLWSSKSPVFQRIALHSGMSPSLRFSSISKLTITIAGKKAGITGARKLISIYKIPIRFSNPSMEIKQVLDMNRKESLMEMELYNGKRVEMNIHNKHVETILQEIREIDRENSKGEEEKKQEEKILSL